MEENAEYRLDRYDKKRDGVGSGKIIGKLLKRVK